MQQIPAGKDGKLTDEQRRRSVYYAFDLLAGFADDSDKNKELAEQMKQGFTTEPPKDEK
jgi:hypothetical protein